MNNYIIIGDSITYGIGDLETGGWATMFKKHIVSSDNSKVCNNLVHIIGFPGAISTDILNKIDFIYNTYHNEGFKNVIILSIGINDTQEFNGNLRCDIDQYKLNIEKIVNYTLNKNIELTVLGLTRIESNEKFFWKPNKYYDNKTILEFDNELKNICEKSNIKYISMKDVLQKGDYIDGLHPNTNGHRKIYETVKNVLM